MKKYSPLSPRAVAVIFSFSPFEFEYSGDQEDGYDYKVTFPNRLGVLIRAESSLSSRSIDRGEKLFEVSIFYLRRGYLGELYGRKKDFYVEDDVLRYCEYIATVKNPIPGLED